MLSHHRAFSYADKHKLNVISPSSHSMPSPPISVVAMATADNNKVRNKANRMKEKMDHGIILNKRGFQRTSPLPLHFPYSLLTSKQANAFCVCIQALIC